MAGGGRRSKKLICRLCSVDQLLIWLDPWELNSYIFPPLIYVFKKTSHLFIYHYPKEN